MNKKLLALAVTALLHTSVFAEGFTLSVDGFTNNGDGTVTDDNTGLVWQACAAGQTYNDASGSCDGKEKRYSYNEAIKLTSNFGGKQDWRLPTISELNSIVDLKKYKPAINKSLFPNSQPSVFWSSSVYDDKRGFRWSLDFSKGAHDYIALNNSVRFVSGEQSFYSDALKPNDFIDNKDGTVTHTKTGLTWQRCAVGQTWDSGSCDGEASKYTQEDATKLTSDFAGQADWRLPSYKELLTIVDYTTKKPATNLVIFPNAPANVFWTSTSSIQSIDRFGWSIDFSSGQGQDVQKVKEYSARLVRGTLSYNGSSSTSPATQPNIQPGGVDLNVTLTANPSPAKMGGDLTYTANISNKGKATATGTKVTFYLSPNFMSFKNASAGCETTQFNVICNIGDLAAGGNTTKNMTVNLKKAGGISTSALVKSNEPDTNATDNIGKVATGVKK